jgi:hypothetical protein
MALLTGCTVTSYGYATPQTTEPVASIPSAAFPSRSGIPSIASAAPPTATDLEPRGYPLAKGETRIVPEDKPDQVTAELGDLIVVHDYGVQTSVPPILVLASHPGVLLIFQVVGHGTATIANGPDGQPNVRITVLP